MELFAINITNVEWRTGYERDNMTLYILTLHKIIIIFYWIWNLLDSSCKFIYKWINIKYEGNKDIYYIII